MHQAGRSDMLHHAVRSLVARPAYALVAGLTIALVVRRISPGYFRTMRIPELNGRTFDERDVSRGLPVAIVSRSFADRYWRGEDPIGFGQPPAPTLYLPYAQSNVAAAPVSLVVRTNGDPDAAVRTIARAIHDVDAAQPLSSVTTLERFLSDSLGPERFRRVLLTVFACLGLALAAVGIYGVTSRGVAERSREMGVRLAFGCEPGQIWRLVLGQSLAAVVTGCAVGVPVAAAAVALLRHSLPARRATRVDPLRALRQSSAAGRRGAPAVRGARCDVRSAGSTTHVALRTSHFYTPPMRAFSAITFALLTLAQATPSRQTFFQSPYPIDQMRNRQAVVETSLGTFVMELLPDRAPNHVGHFIKAAKDGAYVGTIFHRVVRYGIIQGGDPLSRDLTKSALYGSGGMNELRAESSGTEPYTAGAVAAVLLPGKPDSAGAQFFVCVTDQPGITGGYTIFARVIDGIEVVQQISAVDADANGRPASRIEIKNVTIRDPPPVPFAADSAAELAGYRAVLQTSKGEIELQMLADLAPETVRSFLRWSAAGVYDGVKIHRVVPDFVIQMGSLGFRTTPISVSQQKLVHNLPPEFSPTPNLPGVVSIARGEDPGSGSTSFFICTGECRALEGTYTVFARVVRGMDVVKVIEAGPVDGETPKDPVVVTTIRVEKKTAAAPRRPSPPAR